VWVNTRGLDSTNLVHSLFDPGFRARLQLILLRSYRKVTVHRPIKAESKFQMGGPSCGGIRVLD
jgi:hypothetical protein